MATIKGPPSGATRNRPITQELADVLDHAATVAAIDVIDIVSGGQPAIGEGGSRTGSTRHDHGRAADCKLIQGGRTLTFTDDSGGPVIEAFVTAAAEAGATGIGAGLEYMGNATIHVGFGTSPSDHSRLVWGKGGASATAPAWLKAAAEKGWRQSAGGTAVAAAAPANNPA